jgi:hypothetical protein
LFARRGCPAMAAVHEQSNTHFVKFFLLPMGNYSLIQMYLLARR